MVMDATIFITMENISMDIDVGISHKITLEVIIIAIIFSPPTKQALKVYDTIGILALFEFFFLLGLLLLLHLVMGNILIHVQAS